MNAQNTSAESPPDLQPEVAHLLLIDIVGFSKLFVSQIKELGPLAERLPMIAVSGYGSFGVAQNGSSLSYSKSHNDTHDLSINFTRVLHAHTVRFGVAQRAASHLHFLATS